jgi:hypothetical protein
MPRSSWSIVMKRRARRAGSLAVLAVSILALSPASAHDHRPPPHGHNPPPPHGHAPPPGHGHPPVHAPPPVYVRPPVTVVRPAPPVRWYPGNPGWWHGHPDFVGYVGVRRGYYFAPGYGYYPVASAYYGRVWVVGAVLPVELRRYYVVNPGYYGLAVAPAGHAWIYANGSIVLASRTTGVIVRTVPRVW